MMYPCLPSGPPPASTNTFTRISSFSKTWMHGSASSPPKMASGQFTIVVAGNACSIRALLFVFHHDLAFLPVVSENRFLSLLEEFWGSFRIEPADGVHDLALTG